MRRRARLAGTGIAAVAARPRRAAIPAAAAILTMREPCAGRRPDLITTVAVFGAGPYRAAMTNSPPLQRIEAAIARIESATAARRADREALARRHARLRESMTQAIAALDEMLAREDG